jgi:hypothetical protein
MHMDTVLNTKINNVHHDKTPPISNLIKMDMKNKNGTQIIETHTH